MYNINKIQMQCKAMGPVTPCVRFVKD